MNSEKMYSLIVSKAPQMVALLRAYVADDPCAPNDPRYAEAVAILAEIDQLALRNEARHECNENGKGADRDVVPLRAGGVESGD